jgi:hypothetical protein
VKYDSENMMESKVQDSRILQFVVIIVIMTTNDGHCFNCCFNCNCKVKSPEKLTSLITATILAQLAHAPC